MPPSFHEVLSPERLTEVIDIGANPIDGEPPYTSMLAAGLCRVTGFEPQAPALAKLQRKAGPLERYLGHAVGDGAAHTLKVCAGSGMTSLLEPDPRVLALFDALRPFAQVKERVPVQTRRLDDIDEIVALDFLKIDIQGGELAVFRNGAQKLSRAVAVQVEVPFLTLYEGQPTLGDIDSELRRQGFVPHCFAAVKAWPIAPCVVDGDPFKPVNQLLEADLVYARDFSRPESMDDEQLKHLALVAHHCYGSIDLAMRCVMLLVQRKVVGPDAMEAYTAGLEVPVPSQAVAT